MSNISRRDFLKTAGVMTLAVAAAGVLAGCEGNNNSQENEQQNNTTNYVAGQTATFGDADHKFTADVKYFEIYADKDAEKISGAILAVKVGVASGKENTSLNGYELYDGTNADLVIKGFDTIADAEAQIKKVKEDEFFKDALHCSSVRALMTNIAKATDVSVGGKEGYVLFNAKTDGLNANPSKVTVTFKNPDYMKSAKGIVFEMAVPAATRVNLA